MVFLMVSCASNGQDSKKTTSIAETVSVSDFERLLKENPGTVLDVRTSAEYDSGNITASINIDWYSDEFDKEVEKLEKQKPVYVYCKSGGRSRAAMKRLKSLGFEEIYNLNGGMSAWKEAHP